MIAIVEYLIACRSNRCRTALIVLSIVMLCSTTAVNTKATSIDVTNERSQQNSTDLPIKRERSVVSHTTVKVAKTDSLHAATVKSEQQQQSDSHRRKHQLRQPKKESHVKTESAPTRSAPPLRARKQVQSR